MVTVENFSLGSARHQSFSVAVSGSGFWKQIMLFVSALTLILDAVLEVIFAKSTTLRVRLRRNGVKHEL
ncbi:MAG: hypothetical protein M1148_03505 [Candidatus Thermoplasmatota archaeon]|nr:hypothetical protein [Candidatus Thermoplasmatota archaeon]